VLWYALFDSICFVDFSFVLARYVLAQVGVLAQLCFGSIVFFVLVVSWLNVFIDFCFGCVFARYVLAKLCHALSCGWDAGAAV